MKFAVLGDTHFDARDSSNKFNDFFELFFTDFFDYLVKNDIDTVFQLGDLFDRRKFINFNTLSRCREYFFDKAKALDIKVYVLIGNHDIFYRQSLKVNSVSLLTKGVYPNIIPVETPTVINFNGTSIDIIPWICDENQAEITDFISKSKSDLCMGHFEIAGFAMYKGVESHEGLSPKMFEKYELTLSGHYHTRSQQSNITYVGTPYEITWQDWNDPRGFHVFDTITRNLEFIPNRHTIFTKITYDDNKASDLNANEVENKFVKVIVVNKPDLYKFDGFMKKLLECKVHDVKVVEHMESVKGSVSEESVSVMETSELISKYIQSIDTSVDKSALVEVMRSLHVEATNMEKV
jgi:DNA repair exonuclease SbcCD nuclease subunit